MGRLYTKRIVIYPKDVENLLGKRRRSAYDLLQRVRLAIGKPSGAFVTLREFCWFTRMDDEEVGKELRKG